MDLDAYVAAHRREWERLETLLGRARRPRRLTGREVDELVDLYQRTATHLSVIQSAGRDPLLIAKLSSLVARARGAVAGGRQALWQDVARFLREDFPAVCYRTRWWWLGSAAAFIAVATAYGVFIAQSPEAQLAVAPPEVVKRLVERDFADYYTSAPAQDFASRVFTNNVYVAAQEILFGFLLLPGVWVLYQNALNVGIAGGLMAANGRSAEFFGLILPHGILELTAVFVAAGLGLKLGWTAIDPGNRTRTVALGQEGRALVVGALGLAVMLLVSGFIEGFVTPSGLPTWARIGIGVLAEALFLTWVFVWGRRAHNAGVTGDLRDDLLGDTAPTDIAR
ncbi:MAG: stage II sporulation protein M [Frankiaceae bacterium]|nr:stage II sporulation protein M [Frankiaceae bacterium]